MTVPSDAGRARPVGDRESFASVVAKATVPPPAPDGARAGAELAATVDRADPMTEGRVPPSECADAPTAART